MASIRGILTASLLLSVALSDVGVARAEYEYQTCSEFGRYGGLILWMAVVCAWCLLYPNVATVWIKHRVAGRLVDLRLGTEQSADRPGTRVLGWTLAVVVLSFVYWFVIGFACSLGAHITPLSALLPYFAAAAALLRINVWLSSKRILAWHAQRANV